MQKWLPAALDYIPRWIEFQMRQTETPGCVVAIAAKGDPGRLNRPLVRALGEHGLLEFVFAGSAVELCELREGLAHGCTEAETALALQGLGGYPILSRGRPAVRDAWIPRLSSGDAVAGFALSEPDAGSDAASLELQAKRDRDGFRQGPSQRPAPP